MSQHSSEAGKEERTPPLSPLVLLSLNQMKTHSGEDDLLMESTDSSANSSASILTDIPSNNI